MASRKAEKVAVRTQVEPRNEEQAKAEDPLIAKVVQLLKDERPTDALGELANAAVKTHRVLNAMAVCQLRLGNAERAVDILRGLVLHGQIHYRTDVPPIYLVNFAAALLATGRLEGFLGSLNAAGATDLRAARYRAAYEEWRASRTLGERLKASLLGVDPRPFRLDFPPGEIE